MERLVWPDPLPLPGMVTDRPRGIPRRAFLVRHAEQGHRRPLDRQTEREESGREVEGLEPRLTVYLTPETLFGSDLGNVSLVSHIQIKEEEQVLTEIPNGLDEIFCT